MYEGDLLVDGHVHFHDCFEVEAFLDAAVDNFREGAWNLGLEPEVEGCLLLAECAGERFFERLRSGEIALHGGDWTVRDTDEACSLLIERDDGACLVVVAGRQVVTRESVEVLALGTARSFADGLPLRETLEHAADADALAVLPWGLGKWLFQRGSLVAAVLEEEPRIPLFLGDNGGRPRIAPEPGLFRTGAARGVRVLPGSDPLPVPSQQNHVARYGFVMEMVPHTSVPARNIVRALRGSDAQPRFFGDREWLGGFVRSQLALQWKNRGPLGALAEADPGSRAHG
jgi:hypothetical protein